MHKQEFYREEEIRIKEKYIRCSASTVAQKTNLKNYSEQGLHSQLSGN
jgi:hypothetical protein